jgi:hypothetical protein
VSPLCSILIPSRKRPAALLKAIRSIRHTVKDQRRISIAVRYDNDDDETAQFRVANPKAADAWICGPRLNGYFSLNKFYTELALISPAKWVWLFNDDCQIEGDWIDDLARIPIGGAMVHPIRYQIGESMYVQHAPTTCPIVPNQCWKHFGMSEVPGVTDVHLSELLINIHGWKNEWLPGLHLIHERYPDEVYWQHRKLT